MHVAPLHATISEEVFRKAFEALCGNVLRVALIDGRQSGLVEFKTRAATEEVCEFCSRDRQTGVGVPWYVWCL